MNCASSWSFAKLVSSCLSVCPQGTTRLLLDGFSLNFVFQNFSKICREKFKYYQDFTRKKDSLHEDQHTFLIISCSFLLIARNSSDKYCKENKNTFHIPSLFFFENRAIYEIIWKNILEPGRPQMTIWRMRMLGT